MPTDAEIRIIKRLMAAIAFVLIASVVIVNFTPLLGIFFSFLGLLVTIYLIYYIRKIEKQWDKDR